jgi:dihydrolipoamide dehydrogenase
MTIQDQTEKRVYDLAILGGGTGGYVAAIRAAQLGLDVVLIEKNKVGGTCLHQGCIPSKALLRTAEIYDQTLKSAQFGVETSSPTINWLKALERKNVLVQTLFTGVQGLLKKNKVQLIEGKGKIIQDQGRLSVMVNDRQIQATHVIVATGSRPITRGLEIDERQIMTSDQALERTSLPRSIIIVGGGAIGMEWASLYRDCGVEVTLIEALPRILATEDEEISQEAYRQFVKRGVRILLDTRVDFNGVERRDHSVQVPVINAEGQTIQLSAESMLLSIGRQPNVEDIGLEAFNLIRNHSFLKVNGLQQTSYAGVYAIGDVCGGSFAHVAAEQGVIAVEHIAGLSPRSYNAHFIPRCIYSHPEISSIGYSEQAAKEAGLEIKIGKFPFRGISKSLIYGEYEGFAKIITDLKSGKVIGAHVMGPHATDLISEPSVLLANGMNLSQWLQSIHPHPTLSEVFHEAGLAVMGKAIHI